MHFFYSKVSLNMENNITIKALNYKLFKMKRIYNIFTVYSQKKTLV